MNLKHFLNKANWRREKVKSKGAEVTRFSLFTEHNTWDLRFYVKTSGIPGANYGLFAARDFRNGERLCVYAGSETAPGARGDYVMQVVRFGSQVQVDAEAEKWNWCPAKFINSSCGPEGKTKGAKANAKLLKSGAVQSKGIKKGEEIFMSYGREYWAKRSEHGEPEEPEEGTASQQLVFHTERYVKKGIRVQVQEPDGTWAEAKIFKKKLDRAKGEREHKDGREVVLGFKGSNAYEGLDAKPYRLKNGVLRDGDGVRIEFK